MDITGNKFGQEDKERDGKGATLNTLVDNKLCFTGSKQKNKSYIVKASPTYINTHTLEAHRSGLIHERPRSGGSDENLDISVTQKQHFLNQGSQY